MFGNSHTSFSISNLLEHDLKQNVIFFAFASLSISVSLEWPGLVAICGKSCDYCDKSMAFTTFKTTPFLFSSKCKM